MKSLLEKLRSRKILLVIIIIILFFLGIAVLIFSSKKSKQIGLPGPLPTSTLEQAGALAVDGIYPSSGSVELAQTRNSISVFFETEVDPKSITVKSEPSLEFEIKTLKDFPERIILEPRSPWVDKTVYKIKILKGVRSKDNSKELKNDIEIEYKILPVKPPKYDRPV